MEGDHSVYWIVFMKGAILFGGNLGENYILHFLSVFYDTFYSFVSFSLSFISIFLVPNARDIIIMDNCKI